MKIEKIKLGKNKYMYAVDTVEQREELTALGVDVDALEKEEKTKLIKNELETGISKLIQEKIDNYNVENNVSFESIDSLQKYTVSTTYPHLNFINSMLIWNIAVWEHSRSVMSDVLSGNRAVPTLEELIQELPVLENEKV